MFKINFELQRLDMIQPWGGEGHYSLHWFGITDGLLWITVGDKTIYEYNDFAREYFTDSPKYNDYQLARFIEDFSLTFEYISEPIPRFLYDAVEKYEEMTENYWDSVIGDTDEWDKDTDEFFDSVYVPLTEWFGDRRFDSGHLVAGPLIGCFRCGENIKILWKSSSLENGQDIWTYPNGCCEMPYSKFSESVRIFFDDFFKQMDIQTRCASERDWGEITVDKEELARTSEKMKDTYLKRLENLFKTKRKTDWKKIDLLYRQMIQKAD